MMTGLKLGLMPTVFATVAALYFAQDVLIPLAVAVLLAFLLAPVVTRLERLHLGRVGEIQQMVQPVPLEHPVVVADDDTKRLAPALAAG